MNLSLPFSRNRRYLTGLDWLIGVLDCMTRQATGAGNSSQVILELEGRLDADQFRDALAGFTANFPALSGYPSRDGFNLAPFWKMNGRAVAPPCALTTLNGDNAGEESVALLGRFVNTPFSTRREHLAFHLVHAGASRSFLGMTFDHLLFDARGAELFLAEFNAWVNEPRPFSTALTRPVREPYLSCWKEKFLAGRSVNRALRNLASIKAGSFPIPEAAAGRRAFRYQFQQLNESESRAVTESAYATGGHLMRLPYLLALAVEAVDQVFSGRGLAPEHYVIPVSIDRRAARADSQSIFFNQFSFLHFVVSREALASRERLVKTMVSQMYDQTKSRLPEDFEKTMMLIRILPVGILASITRHLFGGNFGTFIFSCLGESAYRSPLFMGCPVTNLLHTPRVSTPPGIGVFVNEFGGRMNVTTAYLEGVLDDAEAAGISARFQPASRKPPGV